MVPQRRPTHEPTAINVKFFESESRKTLEPLSSSDEKRTISLIGAQAPL
jgi:hypothetical protein